eukprot:763696-Pyramimonas_sp.AAC.1
MAAFARAHRTYFGTPLTRVVASGPSGCFRMRPPDKVRHTPHTFRGPVGNSSGCGEYNDGAHNCTWLGPSPSYIIPQALWAT